MLHADSFLQLQRQVRHLIDGDLVLLADGAALEEVLSAVVRCSGETPVRLAGLRILLGRLETLVATGDLELTDALPAISEARHMLFTLSPPGTSWPAAGLTRAVPVET